MEARGSAACSLAVLLTTELVDDRLATELPINSMRNAALLLVSSREVHAAWLLAG
jgi:hypothetical protein